VTCEAPLFPEAMSTLNKWWSWHRGESIVVCGLGPSIYEFAPYAEHFITIGVNDIGRHFDPDYLVIVDPITQFERARNGRDDRQRYIASTKAKAVFSQLGTERLGVNPKLLVKIAKLQRMNPPKIGLPDALPCSNNSTYIAVALAAYMGASTIGMVGVDFVGHSFANQAARLNEDFVQLAEAIAFTTGATVVNLSRQSLIKTIPFCGVERLLPERLIDRFKKEMRA